jgi:transposase-like protein
MPRCQARFSEHKDTPLFGPHLPPEMVISVLHHITEGNVVRKTGRPVGVNREPVARYSRKAGATESLIASVGPTLPRAIRPK